jgi:mitotic-spindle organizing protein 1
MSQLLGTQLDKETLATCIGMIESGVNPEALAVSVHCTHPEAKLKLGY